MVTVKFFKGFYLFGLLRADIFKDDFAVLPALFGLGHFLVNAGSLGQVARTRVYLGLFVALKRLNQVGFGSDSHFPTFGLKSFE